MGCDGIFMRFYLELIGSNGNSVESNEYGFVIVCH